MRCLKTIFSKRGTSAQRKKKMSLEPYELIKAVVNIISKVIDGWRLELL